MARRKSNASKKLTKRQMAEKYQNNGTVSNSHPTKKRGRPRKISQFLESHTTVSSSSGSSDASASTFDVAPPSPIQGVHTPCTPQPTNSDNSDAGHINEADVGLETQSNDDKPMLHLDGQGFLPSRLAASGIGDIITRYYTDPWPSWRKIPARTRDAMFEEFLTKFSISPPDYRWAKRNFQKRASILLTNKLVKARTTLDKPNWIEDGVWEKLCEHWKSEDFKSKSAQAKTNRASNYAASHTGGSISASQHRANMIKETGVVPTPLELYRRLHQHKDNTWVDSRSKNLNEAFTRTMKQLTKSALAQGKPPPNELDVWSDVARSKRGKVYGFGEKSAAFRGGQCSHVSSSSMLIIKQEFGELGLESTEVRGGQCHHGSSSPMELITKEEVDKLRKEMEEVRKERDELQTKVSNTERHNSSSSKELITKQGFDELRREMEEIRKERDGLKTKVSNTERYGSSSSMVLITKQEFDELRRELEELRKERDEIKTKVSNTERHGSSSSMELITKQGFDELRREMEEIRKERDGLKTKVSITERHGSSSSMELITKQEFDELRWEMEELRKERDEIKTKVSSTERHGSSSSMELITKQEFDELRRDMEEVRKERDELQIKVSNTEKLIEENNALIRQMMETINDQSMISMHSRGKSKLR
ncbi:golgin candidate 4-like [Vigna unguiculata]|uniref:golgin candidate 4-like n=1 Tax=Vigna unguiculata TaxID=3917 RepID=UPI0010166D90|nr:golgin candidate 4-like [Vigna unguiculata]